MWFCLSNSLCLDPTTTQRCVHLRLEGSKRKHPICRLLVATVYKCFVPHFHCRDLGFPFFLPALTLVLASAACHTRLPHGGNTVTRPLKRLSALSVTEQLDWSTQGRAVCLIIKTLLSNISIANLCSHLKPEASGAKALMHQQFSHCRGALHIKLPCPAHFPNTYKRHDLNPLSCLHIFRFVLSHIMWETAMCVCVCLNSWADLSSG